MKKNEILKVLESLKKITGTYICPFRYWLSEDTSLALMGVIDSVKEIHICCGTDMFFDLSLKYASKTTSSGRILNVRDDVVVMEKDARPSLIVVDGFCCETLMGIKRHYRFENRNPRRVKEINEFLSDNARIHGKEYYVNGYNTERR